MKRIIKSRVFAFILGGMILGSIGVIAANYAASTIDYTTTKNSEVKNVKMALDDLYDKKICNNWQKIENVLVSNANYIYDNRINLYKCGNVCKISFTFGDHALNTNYKLIEDSKYYPKEEIDILGSGSSNGYAAFKLKTDGNVVVTEQSKQTYTWAEVKNIAYICDN